MFDMIILIILNVLFYKWFGAIWFGIEFILFLILLVYLWIKKYRPVIDSVSLITGAPGTGKTKLMTDFALAKFKGVRTRVKMHNLFIKFFNKFRRNKKELNEIPILVSNYPIRIKKAFIFKNRLVQLLNKLRGKLGKPLKELKKDEMSRILSLDTMLLQERLPYLSVVAISEFGSFVSNQDWKNEFAKTNLDEWVRFIRQYTKGGYLFADDQSSDNVIVHLRRRIGKVYNLQSMRKLPFLKIGIVNVRHLSISEDIKVIEEGHSESMKNTSWLPVFFYNKTYDTHAFSERVKNTPVASPKQYKQFKTNKLIELPFASSKTDKNYKFPNVDNDD